MNYLKKAAVCMTAAAMFAANSVGFMPYESIELPAITANAADIVDSGSCGAEGDNVTWTLDSEGTLTISGKGKMRDDYTFHRPPWTEYENLNKVIIEDGVTSIGFSVFYNCSNITEVSISDSVTKISDDAFYGCEKLNSLTIPDSVTSIGRRAVDNTPWLEAMRAKNPFVIVNGVLIDGLMLKGDVTIPDSVKIIGNDAFSDCTGLTSITIPNSVTSIGGSAFGDCLSLESVSLPDSITEISANAFWGCTNLTSITIPASLSTIENGVFVECSSLTTITIPKNITNIGYYTFDDCSSLKSITIENTECKIADAENTMPDTVTIYGYTGSTAQEYAEKYNRTFIALDDEKTSAEIVASGECGAEGDNVVWELDSEGTLTISGTGAIKSYNSNDVIAPWQNEIIKVVNVVINDGINKIGDYAFADCASLTSAQISDSVTDIGSWAFHNCERLTSITVPESLISIDSAAFWGCESLSEITIPSSVTEIGGSAFYNTLWLENKRKESPFVIVNNILIDGRTCTDDVIIPNSVNSIGGNAFSNCNGITSITIPNSVKRIESAAFSNCKNLSTITVPGSVKSIGNLAFQSCKDLTSIIIEEGVTEIGGGVFMRCENLTSVNLPDSLTGISLEAFCKCTSLKTITIPDNVTHIRDRAFDECTSLESIIIKNPKCKINEYSSEPAISETATIYGYTGSTAQEFAEKYNRTFIALDESPETAPVTTAVTTATKAATTTTTTKAKPVTTTVKTTALYPLTKVVTTTNSIHVDYAPELEYDDSPMKVGETRAIYISDPTGKPVEDIKIMLMNDKISSSYEKGSNVLYITAVKPGKGSISLMIPGGSLTNGASFEIVEDTTVLTTTTVKATTVVTTTATTTAPTPDVILGDVDNNGIMDMSDASYIMAHYNAVACGQESPLNEAQQKAADTNGDGCINSYDAFIVSKIYAAIMTGMDISDVPAYIAENFTYKCVDSADGGYTVEEIAASSVKPTLSVADVEYKLDELAENGYIAEVTLSAEGFDEDVTAFDFHVYYDEGLTPYYTENNGYKNLKVSTMGGAAYCSLGKGFNEADNYIFISLVNRQKENLNGEMIKLYFNVPKDAQSGDKFKVYPEYTKGDVLVSGADNKSHAYLFTQGLKGGTLSIKGDAVTTTVTTTKATTTTTTTATTTIPTTTEPVTTALRVVSTDCKITIDTLPTKTIYNVGEELDLDGGKISIFADVTFTDGENVHGERIDADMSRKNHIQVKHPTGSYIVPYVIKADTSAVDMSVPGEYPVIVKILDATENIVYTSETFNITVKEADTTTSTTTTTTTTTTVTTTITATKSTTTTAATTTTAPTTTTPPTTTEPYFVIGDVNEDGKVDSADASLVLAEYALIQTGGDLTFTEKQKNAADVNKDGKTDSSDASKILEYYAAISTGKDPSWE